MKKKKLPTMPALKEKLWKLVSQFVRRSAADSNGYAACYTCGEMMHWKEGQAGHAIPGRKNAVLFDLSILRFQCMPCNYFQHGRHEIFSTKLIKENGMEWWEKKLEGARQIVKYTRTDIEEMIELFKQKLLVI